MKIILLDTYPVRRGSQVFFEELADSLIEQGLEVKKIYLYKYESDVTIKINSHDILLNGEQKSTYEKFPTVQPSLLRKLIKEINNYRPDVILLNGSRTLKYAAFAKPFLQNKTKLIYRIIDSVVFWNTSKIKQFYYKTLILKNIDAAIGVSKASLNDVIKLYDFKKPSVVIHRCFNASKIDLSNTEFMGQLKQQKGDKKIILFLGNLTQQKRPERFVQTISLLKNVYPNVMGWVVGDGLLKQEVIREVETLSIKDRIMFWGYQKNVFPFLSVVDILLLTSDTEGLPGVTLEAGYFEVPTVCGNVGGVKEFIENDTIGFVSEEKTPQIFADNIIKLLNDDIMAKTMGKNAKNKVITDFDMKIISKKYIDFMQKILADAKN